MDSNTLIEQARLETARAEASLEEARALLESLPSHLKTEGDLESFVEAYRKVMDAKIRLAASRACERLYGHEGLSMANIMHLQRGYMAEELQRLEADSLIPLLYCSGVDHVEMEGANPLEGIDFAV